MEIKQGALLGTSTHYIFKSFTRRGTRDKKYQLEIKGSWSKVEVFQEVYPEFYHFTTRDGYEGVFWKWPIFGHLISLISTEKKKINKKLEG